MLQDSHRLAILLHEGILGDSGKTGLALVRFRSSQVVAVIDHATAGQSLPDLTGIPHAAPIVASVAAALAYQPDVLVIGIAPSGGMLPPAWRHEIQEALAAGLSLVNGLHTLIGRDPDVVSWLNPERYPQQWIWDIRQEPPGLGVSTGAAAGLPLRRVLTIGTDMAVGKMSTSLELHRCSQEQGLRSAFVATGQTGMMIAGRGIPLDAIRIDYAGGAVEQQVMAASQAHDIVHIEGQGSLFHPASSATLPLLRGSQPTEMILVHRAGQTQIRGTAASLIPPLPEAITLYEQVAAASPSFTRSRVVGIALNTKHLDPAAAATAITATEDLTGLPCSDPIRHGGERLLQAILAGG